MRRTASLLALLALTLGACDNPTGAGGAPGVRASFTGAASVPSLEAEGSPVMAGNLVVFSTFGAARDTAGTLTIVGFEESGGEGNLFVLQMLGNMAGTYEHCGVGFSPECHGRYIIGVRPEDVSSHDAWYEITAGSVHVTSVADGRARGEFDVTLSLQSGSGQITARGEFNVPIVAAATGSAMACFGNQAIGQAC